MLLLHTLMHEFPSLSDNWRRLVLYTHPPFASKNYRLAAISTQQAQSWGQEPACDSTGATRNLLCSKPPQWAQSQLCRSPPSPMQRSRLHKPNAQMGLMTTDPRRHRLRFLCVHGAQDNEPDRAGSCCTSIGAFPESHSSQSHVRGLTGVHITVRWNCPLSPAPAA